LRGYLALAVLVQRAEAMRNSVNTPLNPGADLQRRFVSQALQNPHNAALLGRLPFLGLPDAWLVAGCLFQTVWNLRSGLPPTANIKDYDAFYFDALDLSESAEQAVQARASALFAGWRFRPMNTRPIDTTTDF
jgi:hypothetical protein